MLTFYARILKDKKLQKSKGQFVLMDKKARTALGVRCMDIVMVRSKQKRRYAIVVNTFKEHIGKGIICSNQINQDLQLKNKQLVSVSLLTRYRTALQAELN